MRKYKIAIVIPCYNEDKTILRTCNLLYQYGDIVVVNDNSTDNSKNLLKNNFKHINNKKNLGYELSVLKGIIFFLKKNYDYLITIDADLQHSPLDIPRFISYAEKNHSDIVVGNRNNFNRFSEYILDYFFYKKFNIKDPICGYKIYKCSILRKIIKNNDSSLFLVDLLIKAKENGLKVHNINIFTKKRNDQPRVGSFLKSNFKIILILIYIFFYIK